MALIEVSQPQTGADVLASYKATRARLFNPVVRRPVNDPEQQRKVIAIERARDLPWVKAPKVVFTTSPWPRKRPSILKPDVVYGGEIGNRTCILKGSPYWAKPAWRRILEECAKEAGVHLQDLIGPRRSLPLIPPRHKAMWRMSREAGMSLPAIGRRIGKRDHSTVFHGIRRHQQRIDAGEA